VGVLDLRVAKPLSDCPGHSTIDVHCIGINPSNNYSRERYVGFNARLQSMLSVDQLFPIELDGFTVDIPSPGFHLLRVI